MTADGLELRQLITFRAVVTQGSLLRAAETLGYAQSTVTLHVQQLEAALGVPLFERQGKRLTLTEAGRALGERAAALLEQVASLRQSLRELGAGFAGHVRLGSIEPAASLRLPAVLARFRRDRPRVRLSIDVAGTLSVSARVAARELDAAVCSPPPAELDLQFEPLYFERLGLLLPRHDPLARLQCIRPADLDGHHVLLTERTCAYRGSIERILQEHGANPACDTEISSMEALRYAVQHGLGPAILPLVAASPPPPGTVLREIEGVELGLPIGIARRRGGPALSAAMEALLEALRGELSATSASPRFTRSSLG